MAKTKWSSNKDDEKEREWVRALEDRWSGASSQARTLGMNRAFSARILTLGDVALEWAGTPWGRFAVAAIALFLAWVIL